MTRTTSIFATERNAKLRYEGYKKLREMKFSAQTEVVEVERPPQLQK